MLFILWVTISSVNTSCLVQVTIYVPYFYFHMYTQFKYFSDQKIKTLTIREGIWHFSRKKHLVFTFHYFKAWITRKKIKFHYFSQELKSKGIFLASTSEIQSHHYCIGRLNIFSQAITIRLDGGDPKHTVRNGLYNHIYSFQR